MVKKKWVEDILKQSKDDGKVCILIKEAEWPTNHPSDLPSVLWSDLFSCKEYTYELCKEKFHVLELYNLSIFIYLYKEPFFSRRSINKTKMATAIELSERVHDLSSKFPNFIFAILIVYNIYFIKIFLIDN